MAEIIPFPRIRDRAFVQRHAYRMTTMRAEKSEQYLFRLISQQFDTLCRKGVPDAVAERHCRALECAIRAALWHVVMTPGGAA